MGERRIFKATYQDKALNVTSVEFEATSWPEAIAIMFEKKRADQKVRTLSYVRHVDEK